MQIKNAAISQRIGSYLLESLLQSVTLFIGWAIWSMFTWKDGQTPAKKLLRLRVVDATTRECFNFKQMFKRQVLYPLVLSSWWVYFIGMGFLGARTGFTVLISIFFISCLLFSISLVIIDLIWFVTDDNRRLIDYWAKSIVIQENE